VEAFLAAGASVTCLDINPDKVKLDHPQLFTVKGDISSESSVQDAFRQARERFGTVHTCVALASLDFSVLPHHESLIDMSLEQWQRTFTVNVQGTFLTAREWLRNIKTDAKKEGMRNVGLIIIGSESGHFGERGNADYASGKAAVQVGMIQSLKGDVVRIYPSARVNAVAPGPVDTPQFQREIKANPDQLWLDAQATTALRKPVPTSAVAKSIVFLASENWSSHIHGQVLNVDSGKQGKVHWMKDECQ